jgi:hypothetical protein
MVGRALYMCGKSWFVGFACGSLFPELVRPCSDDNDLAHNNGHILFVTVLDEGK